jgi:hypothetical protein
VLLFIVPRLADHVIPPVAPPLVVVLKGVEVFAVTVGAEGEIALTTTVCGVTSAD